MAYGISKKRAAPAEPVDIEAREAAIQKKIYNLANAIKIPPPINQFNTHLSGVDLERTLSLLRKYSPETKEQKVARLQKENPREGPKPILLKFGLRHVVDLIERRKLAFVVIAADVAPITLVLALPTLCKELGIAYAIVPSKEVLGSLVHLKSNAVIGLEGVRPEDNSEFAEVIGICNAVFMNEFEKHMTTVGGRTARKTGP